MARQKEELVDQLVLEMGLVREEELPIEIDTGILEELVALMAIAILVVHDDGEGGIGDQSEQKAAEQP